MQTKALSESGFFNLRTITGCAFFFAATLLAYFGVAAPPSTLNASDSRQAAPASLVPWQDKVDATVLNNATLGETEFLIYMKQQADLSGSSALKTKEAKGQYVYQQLTANAQATQGGVKQALNQLGAPYKAFWISNTISTKGNLAVVEAVALLPEVAAIYQIGKGALKLPPQINAVSSADGTDSASSPKLTTAAEPGLARVKAPEAWALGYEGQGVVVAGADTGVRFTHTALRNQYRGWGGAPETSSHDYNWHDAIHIPNWPPEPLNACNPGGILGAGQPSPFPCDDDEVLGQGHGSHTIGSVAGDDGGANEIGMAPQAKWIACRNMSNGVGAIPTYLECMEFFIAPTKVDGSMPDPAKAPHVINNSWGCLEGCPPEPNPLRDSLKASRAAGIFYVASAGNDGPECNTIFHPLARYPEAFTVGSTTHTTDTASGFSSRGPASIDPENPDEPFYLKPDISAPGSSIRSALRGSDTDYGSLSGTSMAGPHVAGLVALIISANPGLAGNVDRIEQIIQQTAEKKTTTEGCGGDTDTKVPNNTFGWGRIDALAAVNMAVADAIAAVPAQLLNISSRARVQTGDNILIGGFIVTGTDPKQLLLRAMGPSLSGGGTPLTGRMSDPTLELRDSSGALVTSNDNWKDSPERGAIEATGVPPGDDRESAIVRTLAPGAYTAVLRGKDNSTGIALVEVYDLSLSVNSLLANISSRSFVETGDNVLIGGFIAGHHPANAQILIRGLGPSLKSQLPNALDDPLLELRDVNGGAITFNDNWQDSPERAQIEATGLAPSHQAESAVLRALSPGTYTAIVRGSSDGIGAVEIYNIR
jgi:subtilisin family serine protease